MKVRKEKEDGEEIPDYNDVCGMRSVDKRF